MRPTSDRVRETLFNWLQPVISGASCLDLFAGTGALGFEAASRGAGRVVLIENDPVLAKQITENIKTLEATEVMLERNEALSWLKNNSTKFDLVFLDPPFGLDLVKRSCDLLRETNCLKPHAMVYIEAEPELELPEYFTVKKQGKAGQVKFLLASLS